MPLLHQAVTEADIPHWNAVKELSFENGLHKVMWPNGISDTTREHLNTKIHRQMADSNTYFFKVVDSSLPPEAPHGGMVGISKWQIHPDERGEEQLDAADAEAAAAGYPTEMGQDFAKAFFGAMRAYKRKNLGGRPYVNLHILAVLPEHHRRGVGKLLMQWGLEEAGRLGLPCYLESTPMGKALYEKCGFEVVNWLPFDAREFGGEVPLWHACMIKEVRRRDGDGP